MPAPDSETSMLADDDDLMFSLSQQKERVGGVEVRWYEDEASITRDGHQSLDEIVACYDEDGVFDGGFHMEQMSDDCYWFSLGNGERSFNLFIENVNMPGRSTRKPVLRLVEQ